MPHATNTKASIVLGCSRGTFLAEPDKHASLYNPRTKRDRHFVKATRLILAMPARRYHQSFIAFILPAEHFTRDAFCDCERYFGVSFLRVLMAQSPARPV